jgi:hypothetical protein
MILHFREALPFGRGFKKLYTCLPAGRAAALMFLMLVSKTISKDHFT